MKLDKEEQSESKVSRRKDQMKIRAGLREIENRKNRENQWNNSFYEKINKIDKILARLTKREKKPQITNTQNITLQIPWPWKA